MAAAMAAADAIVAPTKFSVNHSSARLAASQAGARLIFMPDICDEVFLDGSLNVDFLAQKIIIDEIADILTAGSTYHVTSPAGTDLRAQISGKRAVPQSGICHTPGSISPPPCIEVAIAPDEGSAGRRSWSSTGPSFRAGLPIHRSSSTSAREPSYPSRAAARPSSSGRSSIRTMIPTCTRPSNSDWA